MTKVSTMSESPLHAQNTPAPPSVAVWLVFGASVGTLFSFAMFWLWCWAHSSEAFGDVPAPPQLDFLTQRLINVPPGPRDWQFLKSITWVLIIFVMIAVHLAAYGLYWSVLKIRHTWRNR
jgi:hypothetical protein